MFNTNTATASQTIAAVSQGIIYSSSDIRACYKLSTVASTSETLVRNNTAITSYSNPYIDNAASFFFIPDNTSSLYTIDVSDFYQVPWCS